VLRTGKICNSSHNMVRSTVGIQPRFTAVRQTSSWERSRRVLHRLHQVAVLLGAEFRYRPFVRLTGRLEPTGLLEVTQRFPCPSAMEPLIDPELQPIFATSCWTNQSHSACNRKNL